MNFFKNVETWFSKVFSKAPSATATALAVVNTVAPMAEVVIAMVDPSEEAVAQPIITEIQADLAVLANTLKSGSTTNVNNLVASIQANLSNLLAAGHIKDPATIQKATALVNLISSELKALLPNA
jgi:hypothetical protein